MTDDTVRTATQYRFQIFVAGNESKSMLALANLRRMCEAHVPGRYEITLVDVIHDFRRALEANILLTPAVRLIEPAPPVTLFGTLVDRDRVLAALRLEEHS